ncbi:MAG: hypothetical protein D6717_11070 [Gammaproteobacteria bacterium]|nr:MAG: hypothetical protein D6717_11070 [Gammaproteobacteria bacterium]
MSEQAQQNVWWRPVADFLGIELQRVSHVERWVSGLGGVVGIAAVFVASHFVPDTPAGYIVVASMGASAVLLFAVPHGPLSQPWPLVGGHLISAVVGVTVALHVDNPFVAGPLAVGLAILAMHYARCIHPPGGATSLSAVLLGPSIHSVGYAYVLAPVLVNVAAILLAALAYNAFFPWRRYPAMLARLRHKALRRARPEPEVAAIPHESFVYALSEIDSMLDVSEADLLRIYELATEHKARQEGLDPNALQLGHYYSNGRYGDDWSVRQIVDWDESKPLAERQIIYKVVAGKGRRGQGVATGQEFARWARHEVYRDDENWRRVN